MEAKSAHILEVICNRALACARTLNVQLKAIYVFGSFGTGHFRAESDIDLGMLCERVLSADEKIQMIKTLNLPGGHVIDLVDLSATDLEMQDVIISERRRIYTLADQKAAVEDFEHYVWVMYLTLCEDRKEIIDQIKKTGVIYGPDYIEKGRIRRPVHKTH